MPGFMDRLKKSFDVLRDVESQYPPTDLVVSMVRQYRSIWRDTNARVLAPIVTRIAVDASSIPIRHVDCTPEGYYKGLRDGELNDRLAIQTNLDQTPAYFFRDAVMTMLEEGVVAMFPTETSVDPSYGPPYDILSMRVGRISEWYNRAVRIEVWDDARGRLIEMTVDKRRVAIAQNPLYAIMNEPNSTLKRLIDKLVLLDLADNDATAPNLDLILQLPYAIRGDKRLDEAEQRRTILENQLNQSRYGVAYIDATEKITQLNRPVTNVLSERVDKLTSDLFSQLGLTPEVFSGAGSPGEELVYNNKTIRPILTAITEAMTVTFLTRTAIRQGQRIVAIPDLFKMEPLSVVAESSDKLTRNEIMTSNEIRARIGLPPSEDPGADKLRNKNLNQSTDAEPEPSVEEVEEEENSDEEDT